MSDGQPPIQTPEQIAVRQERFETQTKEQFETLGRFVQAFEEMAHAARLGCQLMFSPFIVSEHGLFVTMLHHSSMTAKPVFEIWRAFVMQLRKLPINPTKDAEEDYLVMKTILTQTSGKYNEFVNLRNNLLHGTWRIGWTNEYEQEWLSLNVHKFQVGKDGLKQIELPLKGTDLAKYNSHIKSVECIIARASIVVASNYSFTKNFRLVEKQWWSSDDPNAPASDASSS